MKLTTALFAATAITLSAAAHADARLERSTAVAPVVSAAPTERDALADIFAKILWQGDNGPAIDTESRVPLRGENAPAPVRWAAAPAAEQRRTHFSPMRRAMPQGTGGEARDDLYQTFARVLWNGDGPSAVIAKRAR